MKTFLATLAVLVGGMTVSQSAQAACVTPASLAGTYGYVASGFSLRSLSAGGFGNEFFDVYSAAGSFTIGAPGFNGSAPVTVTDTVSINGNLFRQESYGGTVSLNVGNPGGDPRNCMGTLVLNSGVLRTAYDFVVVEGGAKLLMVDSDQGQAITGSAER